MSTPTEYVHVIKGIKGLRSTKDYTKFHCRFKIEGKQYSRIFDYSEKVAWTPKVKRENAKKDALAYRAEKELQRTRPFNPDSKVDFVAAEYFDKKCADTEWTKARQRLYELYIRPFIGNRRISTITENSIDTIRKNMETTNHHQYMKGGNSIRSIEKVLFQTLKPILVYAQSNGAIDKLPPITIPNRPKKSKRKKRVSHASDKLITLHRAIHTRYKDDPFYRALFLFALNGRRWNEIRTLRWQSVDLIEHRYTIEADYNKVGETQDYFLSDELIEALEKLQTNREGLVFASPRTSREMDTPRKQLTKLKADTGIEELTMHYFRHILVTALGEYGMAATSMSAALGHTRAETVDQVYRTINHLKGSQDAVQQIKTIIDKDTDNG